MVKTTTLPVVSRMEFHKDPFFSDCWNVTEKEHIKAFQERTPSGGFYRQKVNPYTSPTSVHIPWKWDNVGRIQEMFSTDPPEFEKSSEVQTYKSCHKLLFDVQGFKSEDLKVTVTDRTITIDGTHKEAEDESGSITRSFTRHYVFPPDALMDDLDCSLSSDGVLHISAPRTHLNNKDSMGGGSDSISNSDGRKKLKENGANGSTSLDSRERNSHSILALPNFDMVPFSGPEMPNNSPFGIKSDKENFKIVLDMRSFGPKEVNVFCTPHCIIVEGDHLEREDGHGRIARKFSRKYWMPTGVLSKDARCYRSNDGVVEIMAPWPKIEIDDEKLVRLAIENKN